MKNQEIFSTLKYVFDLLLLILLLLVIANSLSGTELLSIDLMYMAFVTVIVGIIAHLPLLVDELGIKNRRSGGM